MNDQALPGPGWYPDPNDSATNRYWDGHRWTESRAPIARQKADFEGADGVGYVLAILLPLIGFIIGLVRLNKSRHGIWIVVTSVVIFILWLALISSAGTANAQAGGVTLEPGTNLTVTCKKQRPFQGLPFSHVAPVPKLPRALRVRGHDDPERRLRAWALTHPTGQATDQDSGRVGTVQTFDALTFVRNLRGARRFRVRNLAISAQPVVWRGC